MTLEITTLTGLDEATVQQSLVTQAALLAETDPDVDVRFGVINTLLLRPQALFSVATQQLIDQVRRSSTLAGIAADPSLADPEIVASVARTRGLVVDAGAQASGEITIVISALSPSTIPTGAQFFADGKTFETLDGYTAQTSEDEIASDTDRVLTAIGDGTYYFTIPVRAMEVGVASEVKKDTLFTARTTIAYLVKIYAASDFSGGVDADSITRLLEKERDGVSARTLSNRATMSAWLRASEYGDFITSAIIGYGSPEMLRDRHSLFPVSGGGRVDWYVKTQTLPKSVTLTKTAVLVEKTSDDRGIWQVTLTRNDAPGFYDVVSVVPQGVTEFIGSYTVVSDVRGRDMTNIQGELTPDVANVKEATFTRYQTAVIRFKDSETDTTTLSLSATADYDITVRHLPDLAELQSLVGDLGYRYAAGDVLVKAPLPCFLTVTFRLLGRLGALLPDVPAIQAAVSGYVNSLALGSRLYASAISNIVADYLAAGVYCSAIDLFGQLLKPDGSIVTLRSTEMLTLPDDPDNMCSPRTATFYLPVDQVRVTGEVAPEAETL